MATTPGFYDNTSYFGNLPEDEATPGTPLPVDVILKNPNTLFETEFMFLYKPDPVINKFYPRDTIVE